MPDPPDEPNDEEGMPAPSDRGVKPNGLPWWFPDDFDPGSELPPHGMEPPVSAKGD
jgi:hypothetical protein